MFRKYDCEVLVVGAGPVGLFTALQLARRGVRVQVIDQERRTASHSYALALHADSLRMLAEENLADRVESNGHVLESMGLYDGPDRRAELRFGDLPSPGHALVLPQSSLESALEEALDDLDVHVLWNHRLVGFDVEGDTVMAEVAKLDRTASGYPYARMEWVVSKTFPVRSSLLVGADGYSSFVRRRLGIDYADHGSALSFSVYEFEADLDLGGDARLVLNPDDTCVLWPLGGGRFRWSFSVPDVSTHRGEREQLLELIGQRATWFRAELGDIRWHTSVLFERRLAERFGSGRIWLAGDAAHITGPVGGQSMNVGLREGRELAECALGFLRENRPIECLEDYGARRSAEWRRLLGLEGRVASESADPWIQQRADRLLPCVPGSGPDLATLLAQVGLQLQA